MQNPLQSQSNPQPATSPPAQASDANPAAATTDAAVNAVAKHVAAKDAAKDAAKEGTSVPPKPRATALAANVRKALVDVAEAIALTVAVAKKLPRQKLRTQLFQPRLWHPTARPPRALRVKNPKAAVVVVDAVSVQANPRRKHKFPSAKTPWCPTQTKRMSKLPLNKLHQRHKPQTRPAKPASA